MADLAAIQQLLARYCYAHDTRNLELLGSTFAEDVRLLGAEGRENVVNRYAEGYKSLTIRRRHVLTNFIVLEDGDTEAVVQSYITLYLIKGKTLELHLIGVYRDHVVLEDGEWKISWREAEMDVPYNPGDVAQAGGAVPSGAAGTASVRAHIRIERPADAVWAAVTDPTLITHWFPGVKECTVEVPGVRRVVAGPGVVVHEELVTNDAALRRFQYSLRPGVVPVDHHLATVDVLEDGASSLVVYSVDVAPASMGANMQQTITAAVSGLKAYVEKQ